MPVIAIDLPFPPSVNALWKMGRNRRTGKRNMYRSKRYVGWLRQADGEWMAQKPRGPFKTIEGPFTVHLNLSRPDKRLRDDHNFLKAPMDWAQHAGIIRNDGDSVKSTTGWVEDCEAPMGARLIITC